MVITVALVAAVWAAYYPVRPRLMCVMPLGTGATAAYFGYASELDEDWIEPAGDYNYFSPGAIDRSQPTQFAPGSSGRYPEGAFVVTFEGPELTWTLGNRAVTATPDAQRCPLPTTFAAQRDYAYVPPRPPEPPPKPPEPPPEPPKPKATETVTETPDAKKPPTRTPKNQVQKKGQPKQRPKKTPTKTPEPEPAPLVLSDLTDLGAGVAIQSGDSDILGDASVAATRENTNVELVDDPRTVPADVGDGTGGVAGRKRVPPRVTKRVSGRYPDDAPRLSRSVVVRLSLKIGTDGSVIGVRVVKGAGGAFDREAKRVARQLRFSAGTIGGEPAEMWVPWVVEFTPEDW